mgnify:CR=1 FL=1
MQSRYDKKGPGGDGADYINCPLDEAQYTAFIEALIESDQTEFKDFEKDTEGFVITNHLQKKYAGKFWRKDQELTPPLL